MLLALYILFALKMASQWEKAVVLRLGKFREPVRTRHVLDHPDRGFRHRLDRSPRDGHPVQRREDPDQGHRAGRRGRRPFLDGLGRAEGRARSGELPLRHHLGRPDRVAGDHRPDGPGRHPDRTAQNGCRPAENHRRAHHALGRHRPIGGNSRRGDPEGSRRRDVAARRRPNASGRRASSSGNPSGRSPIPSRRRPKPTSTTPPRCICAR